jgi:hypothetical protein
LNRHRGGRPLLVIPGWCACTIPGISRFRVRCGRIDTQAYGLISF